MPTGICPECEGEVRVSPDVETGDYLNCPECDAELEVIEVDPLEFNVVSEAEEEYEEDKEEGW